MTERLLDRLVAASGRPHMQAARAARLARPGGSFKALVRAFRLYARAASAGHVDAMRELGCSYLFGRGAPPNLDSALLWLGRAAEAEDEESRIMLAKLALLGVTPPPPDLFGQPAPLGPSDHRAARRWAAPAAEAGSAEAMALLAYTLEAGPEDMRDLRLAETLYERSASGGCAQGKLATALALLRRREDPSRARALLHEAAGAGMAAAHHALGILATADPDAEPAVATGHFRAAAQAGFAPAQLCLGLTLLRSGAETEGETWLRAAAAGGSAAAAAALGDLYARDGDLPPNFVEAAHWYRRAADCGCAGAARALGRLHLRGPRPDVTEALLWLRDAAARGDEGARADLAALAA